MAGEPHQGFWQEVGLFFAKVFIYLFYIIIGVIVKLAFEAQTMILSKKQRIIIVILSVFAGYLAASICEVYHRQEFAKIIVPVATLLGDSLVKYIITNWEKILVFFQKKRPV